MKYLERVELGCVVKGAKPVAEIIWKKNGKEFEYPNWVSQQLGAFPSVETFLKDDYEGRQYITSVLKFEAKPNGGVTQEEISCEAHHPSVKQHQIIRLRIVYDRKQTISDTVNK